MVFKSDLVVVVKCRGKVLRERDNIVYLPFGSEYSLLIKNLRVVRASVSVSVDGEDVLNGHSLIVNGNSFIELERFIKGSLDHGNRFKFIEKTDTISEFRGDRVDDGIIRVRYQFEEDIRVRPPFQPHSGALYSRGLGDLSGQFSPQSSWTSNTSSNVSLDSSTSIVDKSGSSENFSDLGITVPGSESSQKFVEEYMGRLESVSHVICLQLKGEDPNTKTEVVKPLTVKDRLECLTCGTSNSGTSKFCVECGSGLVII